MLLRLPFFGVLLSEIQATLLISHRFQPSESESFFSQHLNDFASNLPYMIPLPFTAAIPCTWRLYIFHFVLQRVKSAIQDFNKHSYQIFTVSDIQQEHIIKLLDISCIIPSSIIAGHGKKVAIQTIRILE